MISFVILTFNSEKYLHAVLESISWADEVVVVDSGSVDNTRNIVEQFANTKFIYHEWKGFGSQKQFGVDSAKHDWIFVLDSDEIFTRELTEEVKEELKKPTFKAYKVARLNKFFGREIRTMGLYPDYSVRFFNRKFAEFDGRTVHEKVVAADTIGLLKNHFIHEAYESISQFIVKQNWYSDLEAGENVKTSRLTRLFKVIFDPYWEFFRLFIVKGGFLEGWRGFVIAKLYAQYTFWKYVK